MTPDALLQMFSQPDMLRQVSLTDLKRTVEAYPCFAMARMLYVKALKDRGDLDFTEELFKASLASPNRRQLFFCIKGRQSLSQMFDKPYAETLEAPEPVPGPAAPATGNGFDLIDRFLDARGESLTDLPERPAVEVMPYSLQAAFGDGRDLPDGVGWAFSPDAAETMAGEDVSAAPALSDAELLPESAFTLTLAHIYVRQKKYDRALEIFRTLLLKNPEKSIYFADQIKYLEQVIKQLNQ